MKIDAVKWGGVLLIILALIAGSAWAAWTWQDNAYGQQLAAMEAAYQTERTNLANAAARNPEQIANIAYGKRMGNTAPGDGWEYRGRGLIQITGRANYMACGEALGLDLIAHPELLEKPQHACMSAAWFWATNALNTLADAGKFDAITQRINGGQNGAADRQALYAMALRVLA